MGRFKSLCCVITLMCQILNSITEPAIKANESKYDAVNALKKNEISIESNHQIRVACQYPNNTFPFCDRSLPLDTRINNLISLLTLNEKANLLTARKSPAIHRLSVPEYNWGANCIQSVLVPCHIDKTTNNTYCPTNFPQPNALGATFNKTLIYNISVAIGVELRALWLRGLDVGLDCWGPTVNIGRDPRWGRMYEVTSEDPYWNGIYGTMFTLGLQNGSQDTIYNDPNYFGVISTLKHLAAYSLGGYQSFTFDAIVSEYLFQDTYFPPFIASIRDADARGIMCSYNSINGVPACVDEWLLNKTLRHEWNFKGYITSDSAGIGQVRKGHHYTKTDEESTILALEATCDINSGWRYQKYIPQLVNDNRISEALVDKALYNSFKVRFELGLFDGNYAIENSKLFNIPLDMVGIGNEKHNQLNLFATSQVMTLLKNEDSILPFDIKHIVNNDLTIAVIGPHFNASHDLNHGYSGGYCKACIDSILTELHKISPSNSIFYSSGCYDLYCNSTHGFNDAVNLAKESDYILLMFGVNQSFEKEGIDRSSISLPGYQKLLASQICKLGKPTVLVLVNGGILAIDELSYECPAILEAWRPGYYGAKGIIDTVFGKNNPSGKMPVTMYWSNFTTLVDWYSMDITEGIGRTYKYWKGTTPIFSFGWGLSYTEFKFVFVYDMNVCDQVNTYCVKISNVGMRSGYETIFVFIVPPGNDTIPSNEPASKMIKRLVEFDKMYLDVNEYYIFKWSFNKHKHLMLYDKNGNAQVFAGNYTIQFTNGVDQTLFSFVVINNSTYMYTAKYSFSNIGNIFGIVIVNVVVIVIVVICWMKKGQKGNNAQNKKEDNRTTKWNNRTTKWNNRTSLTQVQHRKHLLSDQ